MELDDAHEARTNAEEDEKEDDDQPPTSPHQARCEVCGHTFDAGTALTARYICAGCIAPDHTKSENQEAQVSPRTADEDEDNEVDTDEKMRSEPAETSEEAPAEQETAKVNAAPEDYPHRPVNTG